MPSNFKLGFRQKPDKRDKGFPLSALMSADVKRPVSKSWKPGPVKDQGNIGACVGFACWQIIGGEPVVHDNAESISPFHIYGEARKIDEFDDSQEGTSVRAGLQILQRDGFISAYHWADSVDEVVEYLLTKGGLVFGTRWTNSMFETDANGFVTPKGSGGSGHAYYGYHASWKDKFITFLNSWSKRWGKHGGFRMKFSDIDRLLKEGGVAAAVTET